MSAQDPSQGVGEEYVDALSAQTLPEESRGEEVGGEVEGKGGEEGEGQGGGQGGDDGGEQGDGGQGAHDGASTNSSSSSEDENESKSDLCGDLPFICTTVSCGRTATFSWIRWTCPQLSRYFKACMSVSLSKNSKLSVEVALLMCSYISVL